jgi:hypothetical protein
MVIHINPGNADRDLWNIGLQFNIDMDDHLRQLFAIKATNLI